MSEDLVEPLDTDCTGNVQQLGDPLVSPEAECLVSVGTDKTRKRFAGLVVDDDVRIGDFTFTMALGGPPLSWYAPCHRLTPRSGRRSLC